jgi:hypothetical protein
MKKENNIARIPLVIFKRSFNPNFKMEKRIGNPNVS